MAQVLVTLASLAHRAAMAVLVTAVLAAAIAVWTAILVLVADRAPRR